MKKDVRKTRRASAAVAVCAAAMVVLLALAGVYAYAKYTTSLTSDLSADTDFLSVTSSMEFVDAGGEAGAIGKGIGIVWFEGSVSFTVTLENTGRVAARCRIEIADGCHSFVTTEGVSPAATVDGTEAVVAVDDKAMSLSDPLPAGSEAVICFSVTSDEGYAVPGYDYEEDDGGPGMYSKPLEFTFTYEQAE